MVSNVNGDFNANWSNGFANIGGGIPQGNSEFAENLFDFFMNMQLCSVDSYMNDGTLSDQGKNYFNDALNAFTRLLGFNKNTSPQNVAQQSTNSEDFSELTMVEQTLAVQNKTTQITDRKDPNFKYDPQTMVPETEEEMEFYAKTHGLEKMATFLGDGLQYKSKDGELIIFGANNLGINNQWSDKDEKITVLNSSIHELNTGDGNDHIAIMNSWCNDHIVISNCTFFNTGRINSGSGDDTINVYDSEMRYIESCEGDDSINVYNSELRYIECANGNDSIDINKSTISEAITGGDGEDTIIEQDSDINKINTKGDNCKNTIITVGGTVDKIDKNSFDDFTYSHNQ